MDLAVMGSAPVWLGIAAPLAYWRRQSLIEAWRSAAGRARVWIGWLVLLNVVDWWLSGQLTVHALRHGRPDVLHVHGYRFDFWRRVAWARQRDIPVIYEEHSSPSSAFPYPDEPFVTDHKSQVVIAVSSAAATDLARRFGSETEVIRVPPIVDACGATTGGQRQTGHGDAFVLTCVARLIPEKGIEYLLDAVQQLAPTFPRMRLNVYGDGPLQSTCVARTSRLGLESIVVFRGPYRHTELPGVLQCTDVFVLPSITEGLPLILVEAMACGLPIVATRVGGVPEIIDDGVTGLLVRAGDPQALSRALRSLLEDRARREQLGRAAQAAYQRSGFTAQAVLDRMVDVYCQAIRKQANPVVLAESTNVRS